jgi:DNA-directed RNA polymerase specialized sigma24 family protein
MLDAKLRAFVEAADPDEAERLLGLLLEENVAPLARAIVARKFSAYGGFEAQDLEDVVADVLLALVSRLQALREDAASPPIASLEDFTAVVSYNAFTHHLRRRYPGRSRLKSRVRYLLSRPGRFALWPTPQGLACGLATWRGAPSSPSAERRLESLRADPEKWLPWTRAGSTVWKDPRSLLGALLEAIGGPVELECLVGAFVALVPEPADEKVGASVALALSAAPALPADVALHQRESTERLWREIEALPLRQRLALLLNLRDSRGSSLLWVLPVTGTASLRQIARTLELPDIELAELWNRLPLDDHQLAERLGCSRQQVINLRSAARKRLTRRLEGFRDGGPRLRLAGNTGLVRTSLGDES